MSISFLKYKFNETTTQLTNWGEDKDAFSFVFHSQAQSSKAEPRK